MAHSDLNKLLDAMLPLAKRLVAEFGDFIPYGAFMKLDGSIVDCAVASEEENPPSKEIIQTLISDLRQRVAKREIRAAGICSDVRVGTPEYPTKIDAVQIALEHHNGEAVDVFLPYDLDSASAVRFGKLFATPRVKEFFNT